MIKKPSYDTVPLQVGKTRTVGALGNRQTVPSMQRKIPPEGVWLGGKLPVIASGSPLSKHVSNIHTVWKIPRL